MNEIQIQTSQHTVIAQTPASVAERILALLIDYLIFLGYIIIVFTFGSLIGTNDFVFWMIFSLPVLFYHLIAEIVMSGQSYGKKALNLKVVKTDGSEPSVFDYIIRWAFRLIDVSLLFGGPATLTIILNGKGQRLGDIAAHTSVIKLRQKNRPVRTIYQELPKNYSLTYPHVSRLNTKDIHTIKEVLDYYQSGENITLAANMVRDLKAAIEKKMDIASDKIPIEFLKTVLKDFNFYHQPG